MESNEKVRCDPFENLDLYEKMREAGTIPLGTTPDDGIDLHKYFMYNFHYSDIAVTLKRIVEDLKYNDIIPSAIVVVDRETLPMAIALAKEFHAVIKNIDELTSKDITLVIQALPETPEIVSGVTALASKKSKLAISFAFHTSTYADFKFNPNIIGLDTGGATLPWKRGGMFDLSIKTKLLWILPIEIDTYRKLRKLIGPLVQSKLVQAKPLDLVEDPQVLAAHICAAMHDVKKDAYEPHVKYCSKYFARIKLPSRKKVF